MGELGPEKLILIALVLLLLFGARRIPEIGQSLGSGIRQFKQSLSGMNAPPELPAREAAREPAPGPRTAPPQESAAPERTEPKRLVS